MVKPGRPVKDDNGQVKTSLKIPAKLWERASIVAIKEGTTLADVVAQALKAYLK